MKTKYTKELLTPIVKKSLSWSQVIRSLGLKNTGGNYRHIQTIVKYHQLDYKHFTGQLWSKGQTSKSNPSIKRMAKRLSIPDAEIFKLNGHPMKNNSLTKRLVENHGWEYKCSICNLDTWQGQHLSLDLDHINGNNRDCSFKNLRFLCPNCHRITPTWGNKI